jgi:class 3 adenylate cyclase/tetratricopeptide (TPR) repeat protein
MSTTPKVKRKLAAIMFTDIAGFTEFMSYDEQQAINAVKKKRSIIQPLIKEHNGVFVKEIGDGTLSYFSSAVDASTCAVKLQELTYDEDHLNIRVGLHIGDIVFDGEDVFGEGVNIASRLESLSPVGGVCVSKNVYDELVNKKEFNCESLGLQTLKGIGRLVEVFALKGNKLKAADKSQYKATEVQKHTDDEVPSIAIIPFKNKGAEEDVFYAYGISADLITGCSSAGLIRVAGLNDIEKLDYSNLKYQDLSKELIVRYVSTGTLWKMGEMFQLSIELYDSKDKKVVWSDRWQEKWENLPNIKHNLSDGLLKALDTKPKAEQKKETINPEAYEYYLRAEHQFQKRKTADDIELAMRLSTKSVELDENFVVAKLQLATILYAKVKDEQTALSLANTALEQAEKQDNQRVVGDTLRFIGNMTIRRDRDQALDYFEKSLVVFEAMGDKKGIGFALNSIGNVNWRMEKPKKALNYYEQFKMIAEEIDDKWSISTALNNLALVYNGIGNPDAAIEHLERALLLKEELKDQAGSAKNLVNIGFQYFTKGDFDSALVYHDRGFSIDEALGNRWRIAFDLRLKGFLLNDMGKFSDSLKTFEKALAIEEALGDQNGAMLAMKGIGITYFFLGEYEKALGNLEKSYAIRKELGKKTWELYHLVYLSLTQKQLSIDVDKKEIQRLIEERKGKSIRYVTSFSLYLLLGDETYLKHAFKMVTKMADGLAGDVKEKFLNYPIPKKIIDCWEK